MNAGELVEREAAVLLSVARGKDEWRVGQRKMLADLLHLGRQQRSADHPEIDSTASQGLEGAACADRWRQLPERGVGILLAELVEKQPDDRCRRARATDQQGFGIGGDGEQQQGQQGGQSPPVPADRLRRQGTAGRRPQQ